jgi:hypothetical protein
MDIDQDTFYLDWYNQKPVSGDTVAGDHYLAVREQAYGPALEPWDQGPLRAAALFGRDDGRSGRGVLGHALNYTLRPGERMVFRWDNQGKYPWQREDVEHRYYGNSQLIYALPPAHAGVMPGTRLHGFDRENGALVSSNFGPRLDIDVETPYTIAGGTLRFAWVDPTPGGLLSVLLATNGDNFTAVHAIETNGGEGEEVIALDAALGVAGGPPCRRYTVRIAGVDAIRMELRDVVLETDLYVYPIALPRLRTGKNTLEYTDDTSSPHAVEVRWEWREGEAELGIPAPPAAPETPVHGAKVTGTTTPFAWPEVEGAELYWLRVSRAPHMRYPYRPNYDVYTAKNRYEVPYPGMFNHGETYYWQVRPRRDGVWGGWSPRWDFTWEGPMPPVDVRIEEDGNDLYLVWSPNPKALPPASYRVHASDVRGAAPADDGALNLPAETTRLRVARGDGVHEPGLHAAFYRVSALDAAGVGSGPSPQAALPRPWVYNLPGAPLRAGEPFDVELRVVASPGDMQYRYEPPPPGVETPLPGLGWWEAEAPEMELTQAPLWLKLTAPAPGHEADGYRLSGAPPADAVGKHAITLSTRLMHPNEVGPDAQGAAEFRRYLEETLERTQRFTIEVE